MEKAGKKARGRERWREKERIAGGQRADKRFGRQAGREKDEVVGSQRRRFPSCGPEQRRRRRGRRWRWGGKGDGRPEEKGVDGSVAAGVESRAPARERGRCSAELAGGCAVRLAARTRGSGKRARERMCRCERATEIYEEAVERRAGEESGEEKRAGGDGESGRSEEKRGQHRGQHRGAGCGRGGSRPRAQGTPPAPLACFFSCWATGPSYRAKRPDHRIGSWALSFAFIQPILLPQPSPGVFFSLVSLDGDGACRPASYASPGGHGGALGPGCRSG